MNIFYRSGYSLAEIVIVVAILAILTSIALPNYLSSGKISAKNVCINNLKQIDGAVERWALDNNILTGTVLSSGQEDEIYSYIDGGKPKCPSGGEYTICAVGSNPQARCGRENDEGHKLP